MLLIHLSDIHFRKDEIGTRLDPNLHLRNVLLEDAEAMCRKLGKAPTAILISGDIAFAADPEEYLFAVGWLEALVKVCGCSMADIFLVPGNHDVSQALTSKPLVQSLHEGIKRASDVLVDDTIRGILLDEDSARTLYKALDQFNLFAGQFFCDVSAPDRTFAERDLELNDGSILRLTGLNSALVSGKGDTKGSLFVDPAGYQISRERGVERLVMCHHPYEWLRRGNLLRSHLDDVARIQLFGHDHTHRIQLTRDNVVIAAGASNPERKERGWEPGYNLIEVEIKTHGSERKMQIISHVRIWQSTPGRFHAKVDRDEQPMFRHEIALDTWDGPKNAETTMRSAAVSQAGADYKSQQEKVVESHSMDTLRDISTRFFKLTLSQKSEISGKLGLIEEEDINQPDFERFRRVFTRAKERGLIPKLDASVNAASNNCS